jgi:hypothetical protein
VINALGMAAGSGALRDMSTPPHNGIRPWNDTPSLERSATLPSWMAQHASQVIFTSGICQSPIYFWASPILAVLTSAQVMPGYNFGRFLHALVGRAQARMDGYAANPCVGADQRVGSW